jgi:hypothetical protein
MQKKWGDGWQTGAPQKTGVVSSTPQKNDPMILSVCVKLKDIDDQGRNFKWPKPVGCPRCHSTRIWGHGYVLANFDGFSQSLWLRRYRCPDCNCIIRMKPMGYFRRFQAPIQTIFNCLHRRIIGGRWHPELSRSRQRHWMAALKRKTMVFFGIGNDWILSFFRLIDRGQIPVSRAI